MRLLIKIAIAHLCLLIGVLIVGLLASPALIIMYFNLSDWWGLIYVFIFTSLFVWVDDND